MATMYTRWLLPDSPCGRTETALGPRTRTGVAGIFLAVLLTVLVPTLRFLVYLGPKLSAHMRHQPYIVIK